MNHRDYCYPPDFIVLRNRLDIRDSRTLDAAERLFVAQRLLEAVPAGDFDLAHLKAIHRHLFRGVYEWAGEVRTVDIVKEGSRFQPRRFIETGMEDVHRRVVAARYFRGTSAEAFADGAGSIMGDVNHVHPFREGNGRSQLQYLKQLAQRAGHGLDLTRLERDNWMEASRLSNLGAHDTMKRCIPQGDYPIWTD